MIIQSPQSDPPKKLVIQLKNKKLKVKWTWLCRVTGNTIFNNHKYWEDFPCVSSIFVKIKLKDEGDGGDKSTKGRWTKEEKERKHPYATFFKKNALLSVLSMPSFTKYPIRYNFLYTIRPINIYISQSVFLHMFCHITYL